tara:strand:+ start:64 stop:1401 length:1338 start_codon:yes stop_codon:yes gene_type:complete
MLLTTFFYVMGHGLAMEGLPSGTFFKSRDISGFNFKRLIALSEQNLRVFERKQAVVEVMGRLETLKLGRDYFIEVDTDTLRKQYLKRVRGRNWLTHVRDYFLLTYEVNEFKLPYKLNRKKTMRGLERKFSQREAPQFRLKEGQVIKTSWTPDFTNIFNSLQYFLLGDTEGRFTIAGGWGSQEDLIQDIAKFDTLVLQKTIPTNLVDRAYWILSELLLEELELYLNPGDKFSFLAWISSSGLRPADFQSPYLNLEGVDWNDFYGLEKIASSIYEMILRLGIEVQTHHNHAYFLPTVKHVKPGLDVALGNGQDFVFSNSLDQPLLLSIKLEKPYNRIKIEFRTCLTGPEVGQITEAFRRVKYANMETVVDSSLPKGDKILDRKPLSGLTVGFYRVKISDGRRRKELIKTVQYSSRAGRIRMGSGDVNVFHPDAWRELGLEEVYGIRE